MLGYTSEPLDRELEVTGPVKVVLHASSDAPDTDFVAKLDRRLIRTAARLICARASARALSRERRPADLLEPGKAYEFTIDLVGHQ